MFTSYERDARRSKRGGREVDETSRAREHSTIISRNDTSSIARFPVYERTEDHVGQISFLFLILFPLFNETPRLGSFTTVISMPRLSLRHIACAVNVRITREMGEIKSALRR